MKNILRIIFVLVVSFSFSWASCSTYKGNDTSSGDLMINEAMGSPTDGWWVEVKALNTALLNEKWSVEICKSETDCQILTYPDDVGQYIVPYKNWIVFNFGVEAFSFTDKNGHYPNQLFHKDLDGFSVILRDSNGNIIDYFGFKDKDYKWLSSGASNCFVKNDFRFPPVSNGSFSIGRLPDGTGGWDAPNGNKKDTNGCSNDCSDGCNGCIYNPSNPPTIQASSMTVDENTTNTITYNDLNTTDDEQSPSELTYTLTSLPINGILYKNSIALTSNDTFTQEDINNNLITYTHDGSETTSDSFNFNVSDGANTLTGTMSITVNPVNDAPTIIPIDLIVNENGKVTIINLNLPATDVEEYPAELTYTLTSTPNNGSVQLNDNNLSIGDTFTQDDVNYARVSFENNGNTNDSSFDFTLTDGVNTIYSSLNVLINSLPQIVNYQIELNQNDRVTISDLNLSTTDDEQSANQLTYTITTIPTKGSLLYNGVAITSSNANFTQQDINDGKLEYMHTYSDDSDDSFNFSVSDGYGSVNGVMSIIINPTTSTMQLGYQDFELVYGNNLYGNVKLIGNIVLCPKSGSNGSGDCVDKPSNVANNDVNTYYVDIDSDSSTFNSSSANLELPQNSQIKFALLTWQGRYKGNTHISDNFAKIKFKAPSSSSYTELNALEGGKCFYDKNNNPSYECYKNVTNLVSESGTYTIANLMTDEGESNIYGAWALTVVYENLDESYKNVSVYAGYKNVQDTSNYRIVDIPISGFLTPTSGNVNSEIFIFAGEGDSKYEGDQFKLTDKDNAFQDVDPTNKDNVFDSSINNNSPRDPSLTNNMGIDIDVFSVGTTGSNIITNSQTSTTIRLTTSKDQYYPGMVAFATELYSPKVCYLEKIYKNGEIVDENTPIFLGDLLVFEVNVSNTGSEPAQKVQVEKSFDAPLGYNKNFGTYLNNTLKTNIIGDDEVDYIDNTYTLKVRVGTGADGTNGGEIAVNQMETYLYNADIIAYPTNGKIDNTYIVNYRSATLNLDFNNIVPKCSDSSNVNTTIYVSKFKVDMNVEPKNSDGDVAVGYNENITFDINLTNMSNYDEVNPLFTLNLANGFTLKSITSSDNWNCLPISITDKLTCSLNGTIQKDGNKSKISLTIASPSNDVTLNTEAIAKSSLDTKTIGKSTSQKIIVAELPTLNLTLDANTTTMYVGEYVKFTIEVNSNKDVSDANVTFNLDTLSTYFDSITVTTGQTYSSSKFLLGALSANTPVTIEVTTRAKSATNLPQTLNINSNLELSEITSGASIVSATRAITINSDSADVKVSLKMQDSNGYEIPSGGSVNKDEEFYFIADINKTSPDSLNNTLLTIDTNETHITLIEYSLDGVNYTTINPTDLVDGNFTVNIGTMSVDTEIKIKLKGIELGSNIETFVKLTSSTPMSSGSITEASTTINVGVKPNPKPFEIVFGENIQGDYKILSSIATQTLTIPIGSTIKYAKLYWQGYLNSYISNSKYNDIDSINFDGHSIVDNNVSIVIDGDNLAYQGSYELSSSEITNWLTNGDNYSVSGIDSDDFNGWTLAIVYEDKTQNVVKNVTIQDGFVGIVKNSDVNLTAGLYDTNSTKDFSNLNDTNTTIIGYSGNNGGGDKIDINSNSYNNRFETSYQEISIENITLDKVTFSSGGDKYFVGVVSASVKIYPLTFTSTLKDSNGNSISQAEIGDIITVSVTVTNAHDDNLTNISIENIGLDTTTFKLVNTNFPKNIDNLNIGASTTFEYQVEVLNAFSEFSATYIVNFSEESGNSFENIEFINNPSLSYVPTEEPIFDVYNNARSDYNITTQIVNQSFNLTVQPIDTSKLANKNYQVRMKIVDKGNSNNPTANGGSWTNWQVINSTTSSVSFNFTITSAYRYLQPQIEWRLISADDASSNNQNATPINDNGTPPTARTGTNSNIDPFAVRPDSFNLILHETTLTPITTKRAGEDFNITIQALDTSSNSVNNYNESESSPSSFTISQNLKHSGNLGVFTYTQPISFSNGAITTPSQANLSEVGNFDINITDGNGIQQSGVNNSCNSCIGETDSCRTTDGCPFACIDILDSSCNGLSLISKDTSSIIITPYQYAITNINFNPTSWIYMGGIDENNYVEVNATIVAQNKAGITTTNFTNSIFDGTNAPNININTIFKFDINNTSNEVVNINYSTTLNPLYGGSYTENSDNDGNNIFETIPISGNSQNNVYSNEMNVSVIFNINKISNTPMNPIQIGLREINTTNSEVSSFGIINGENTNYLGTQANDQNASFYYGRIWADNDYQTITDNQNVEIKAEVYYNDSGIDFENLTNNRANEAQNSVYWYQNSKDDFTLINNIQSLNTDIVPDTTSNINPKTGNIGDDGNGLFRSNIKRENDKYGIANFNISTPQYMWFQPYGTLTEPHFSVNFREESTSGNAPGVNKNLNPSDITKRRLDW